MSKYYRDYVWRDGIPYGIGAVSQQAASYKIAMDPYRKRIAIERYLGQSFQELIYDSALLDFRHLKPAEQTAWEKVLLTQDERHTTAAIYNQDDRLVAIETYHFENNWCRSCITTSGHGAMLSQQKIYYHSFGDSFNGVVLYDSHHHPVMCKRYECDPLSGEFSALLSECWDGKLILALTERVEV
jgi:hypothetical protein